MTAPRMRVGRRPLALLLALTALSAAPAQTTSTWDGSAGNWTDAAHWSTNPDYPDSVSYNASAMAGTITLDRDITINGLTMVGANLAAPATGGPFTLTTNGVFLSGVTIPAGLTVVGNSTASINALTLGGTLTTRGGVVNNVIGTGGVVNNLAGSTWSQDSSLSGAGTFNNFGTYSATNGVRTIEWTFINQSGGTVRPANASLQFSAPATHDGRFVLSGTGELLFGPGATGTVLSEFSSVEGMGSVTSSGAAVAVNGGYFSGSFGQTLRTWATNGGTITINGAYQATGQLRADANSAVNLNQPDQPATVPNLLLNGGTLGGAGAIVLNGTAANMLFNGGTLAGTSTSAVRNTGMLTVQQAATKTFARDFTNAGTGVVNWTDGPIRLGAGVTLTNAAGGTFTAAANADIAGVSTPSDGTFDNSGTLTRSTGTGTVTVSSTFHNRAGATVNVQTGTLNLANPGTLAGTFNVSSGATLTFSGTVQVSGKLTGTGTIGGGVTVGGAVAPGTSPGTLTFADGVGFAAGSHYQWELSALTTAGPGTAFDQVAVTGGTLTVAPGALLDVLFTGSATGPTAGDPFWQTEHSWPVVALSGAATSSGPLAFQVDNSPWTAAGAFSTGPAAGGTGVELVWTPAPVPEPGTLALGSLAAGAVARWWRRRR